MLSIIGAFLLAVGAWMQIAGGPPKADRALAQQCRDRMNSSGGAIDARCDETAFASAMTATDAQSAARAISAANNSEVGGNSVSMLLIGLGLVMLVGGIAGQRKARRKDGEHKVFEPVAVSRIPLPEADLHDHQP
jgi:hypothetical protein